MRLSSIQVKSIIDKLVSDSGVAMENQPLAIFMAGLPGAGKTELSEGLISQMSTPILRIDMDELATLIPGYAPEDADKFRKEATRLLDKLLDIAIKERYNFVLDGTFSGKKSLQNVERALRHDYTAQIAYALQDPKVAWEFTKAREKVEHRAIKKSGFVNSYYGTMENLRSLLEKDHGHEVMIDVFRKNNDNTVGERHKNIDMAQIDRIVGKVYNKEELNNYIGNEDES